MISVFLGSPERCMTDVWGSGQRSSESPTKLSKAFTSHSLNKTQGWLPSSEGSTQRTRYSKFCPGGQQGAHWNRKEVSFLYCHHPGRQHREMPDLEYFHLPSPHHGYIHRSGTFGAGSGYNFSRFAMSAADTSPCLHQELQSQKKSPDCGVRT